MIQYIKQSPRSLHNCQWYSNVPWALYVQANVDTGSVPRRTHHASTEKADDLAEVSSLWPLEDVACVAWFNVSNQSLYSIADLQTVLRIDEIVQLNDGTIYRDPARG